MRTEQPKRVNWLIALVLAAATAAAYAPVLDNAFINYDDDLYVLNSPHVKDGLDLDGVVWAFTTVRGANWFPLTRLSWMLDAELFGVDPSGFHATSALLHTLSALLLFAALVSLTGATWRSAFVAGVFALHPLHVESVAWVSTRKDVISALFAMLCLLAYAGWARRGPSLLRGAAVFGCLAAGLMAKPMLVTLPFVLLLLDVWPLGRVRLPSVEAPAGALSPRRAVAEKLPLFALVLAACVVTVYAQESWGTVQSLERLPISQRVGNALVSYVAYAVSAFWPAGLAIYYPHPTAGLPLWKPVVAGVALLSFSAVALHQLRRRPWLAVGWFWYVGMLVPVIGLVQVGSQSRADRYTYLPLVGLSIVVAWGAAELAGRRRATRIVAVALGVVALAGLGVGTSRQAARWRDSETLFAHALRVTRDNHVAHINLGVALYNRKALDEASAHLEEAIRIAPNSQMASGVLGDVRRSQGRARAAARLYRTAIRLQPDSQRWHAGLAAALVDLGRPEEGLAEYRSALSNGPRNPIVLGNYGLLLFQSGQVREAVSHYEEALERRPNLANVRGNLGIALLSLGEEDRGLAELEAALARSPDPSLLRAHLGRALMRRGELDAALEHLAAAVRDAPDVAEYRAVYGRALLSQGRDTLAADQLREALRLGERSPETLNNLAWLLATSTAPGVRAPDQAVALAEEAVAATRGRLPEALDTLAVAQASAGRGADAARTAERAIAAAEARGRSDLAEEIRRRSAGYR